MTVPSPAWAVATLFASTTDVTDWYNGVNAAIPRYDAGRRSGLRLAAQMREENHLADRRHAGQEHGQPVDPDAQTAAGREPVLQGEEVVLVDRLGLLVAAGGQGGLVLEAAALVDRVVEF